jgi:hypothetical protein
MTIQKILITHPESTNFTILFTPNCMDFTSVIPDIFPHYVDIGSMQISQSLIAGMIGTLLFIVLLIIYVTLKNKNPYHKFVQMISYLYETIYATLDEIG